MTHLVVNEENSVLKAYVPGDTLTDLNYIQVRINYKTPSGVGTTKDFSIKSSEISALPPTEENSV